MINYIKGILRGIILGVCLVSLKNDYWVFPLFIGTLMLISTIIEIKTLKNEL